jgi:hypothetical protein
MSNKTETIIDPFAPQEGANKVKFGRLRLFANPVTLESGASYTIKGVYDRDGNLREWRGKKLTKSSRLFHIVMHVKAYDKDGNEYQMAKDYLNSDKVYKSIVYPALTKAFGNQFPTKDYAVVKLEEVPTGETYVATAGNRAGETIEKTAWKVVATFDNETELKKAETEHFSRFTTGANGATSDDDVMIFDAKLVEVFMKNKSKGAPYIVDNFVDDEVVNACGRDKVIAEVEKIIS